jgi:hypothetical protein
MIAFKLTLLVLASCFVVSGCITDPSMWRPDEHIAVSRNCRVVCHKTGVKRYDALDGSCTCRDKP